MTTGEASTEETSGDVMGECMVCGECDGSELLLDRREEEDEEEEEVAEGLMSGALYTSWFVVDSNSTGADILPLLMVPEL